MLLKFSMPSGLFPSVVRSVKDRRRRRRSGQALTYLFFFILALMCLCGLVVDLGLSRLTQRQMQSAVDAGALEALRTCNATTGEIEEPTRQQVSDLVAAAFDDNLEISDGDVAALSAGPVVEFGPGVASEPTASQQFDLPVNNRPVMTYDPTLRTNLTDEAGGDMVSGTFTPGASSREANDYSRADFQPVGTQSFLVRMRRLDEDFASFTDSRSSGPNLPALFGRGALIGRDRVARGMVVRATAIADNRNAISVGIAETSSGLTGLGPLAMELAYWNSLTNDVAANHMAMSGAISGVGRLYSTAGDMSLLPLCIGRSIPAAASTEDISLLSCYAPIYAPVTVNSTTENRVVGFGYVEISVSSDVVAITRRKRFGNSNASAVLSLDIDPAQILTPADRSALLTSVVAMNETVEESLQSPVLVR
jgi:Flp pilus assembly protein TadG